MLHTDGNYVEKHFSIILEPGEPCNSSQEPFMIPSIRACVHQVVFALTAPMSSYPERCRSTFPKALLIGLVQKTYSSISIFLHYEHPVFIYLRKVSYSIDKHEGWTILNWKRPEGSGKKTREMQ